MVNRCPKTCFPWKMLTTMWFDQSGNQAGVAGAIVNSMFRINSIYNCAGSGIRSYGYADAAFIYNSYKVTGVKVEIWFSNLNTTMTRAWIWFNDLATVFTLAQARSFPNATEISIGETAGANNIKYYKKFIRPVDVLDKNTVLAPGYASSFGADPVIPLYLGVSTQSTDGISSSSVNVRFKITQYVFLYDMLQFTT